MNSHSQQGEVRKKEWQWKNESHGCQVTVRFGAGDGKAAEDRVLWTLLQVWKREIVEDEKKHE